MINKKLLLSFFFVAILYSCAPSFEIKSLDDKFSDPKQPHGSIGQNNRLSSKSSQGGQHLDGKGVYIDPFIFKDRQTNKIVSIGFYINHFNFEITDGFNPIQEVIFINDKGERVVLNVKSNDFDFDIGNWNTITKSYNTSYMESSSAYTTIEDFQKLIESNWIEVKIVGRDRTQTYDKGDISSDFLKNLKLFYSAANK